MSRKKVSVQGYIVRKKGMFCICPTDVHMRNLWQKVKWGKKTGTESSTRFPRATCFKKTRDLCQKYGGACTTYLPWTTKGMSKWDEKLDSCAAKKGAKKLVSSDCPKILQNKK